MRTRMQTPRAVSVASAMPDCSETIYFVFESFSSFTKLVFKFHETRFTKLVFRNSFQISRNSLKASRNSFSNFTKLVSGFTKIILRIFENSQTFSEPPISSVVSEFGACQCPTEALRKAHTKSVPRCLWLSGPPRSLLTWQSSRDKD